MGLQNVPRREGQHRGNARRAGVPTRAARINTDYATNTFTLDNAATLDLATCTTPSGAPCQDPVLRPSNRPICPVIDESDNFTFVTLAGGGLFVVNSRNTPMSIIGEYDKDRGTHTAAVGSKFR